MTAAAVDIPPRFARDSPHAWRVVVAGFLACFILFGVAYSFGAFFEPMAKQFGASREATSAIFSITAFLYFLLGPISGHLADRFGPRPVVIAGAIVMSAGLIATSFIQHLWVAYLTYGLGLGIGVACCYVPLLAAVSGWFLRRRNTALGITVSGIGMGTLAVAPLAAELIGHFGWREAYVMLGVGSLIGLLVCAWLAEPAPIEHGVGATGLRAAMRAPDFIVLYFSSMLWSIATAVPFVFLAPFAESVGIGAVAAAALVGIVGLASVVGRLGIGTLADRIELLWLYRLSVLALGLSFAIWLFAHDYPTLTAFAIVMGTTYGGVIALSPAVVAQIFGTRGLGATLGMLYTSSSFGILLGPPLCGAIIDRTGSYRFAIVFTLAATVVSFFILLPLGRFGRRNDVE